MRRPTAIPYAGHLSLALARVRLQQNLSHQLLELARETGMELPAAGATAAGDPAKLRGIPCVGRGIGGGMRGTRPDDCIDRLDDLSRRLGVLARDIPGTSPGSDPVAELFGEDE